MKQTFRIRMLRPYEIHQHKSPLGSLSAGVQTRERLASEFDEATLCAYNRVALGETEERSCQRVS